MLGGEVTSIYAGARHSEHETSSSIQLKTFETAEDIPLHQARGLLLDHVNSAYHKFLDLGAPPFDRMAHVDKFFGTLEDVLPPKGAYFLAMAPDGRAVGTGALRRLSDDTGEMKHLYVRPEARGEGLGERLIATRIAAGRALGLRRLVADTFQGNDPMVRLYLRAGFSPSAPYDSAVTTLTPALSPHLLYFQMDL